MSYQEDSIDWQIIREVDAWLDAGVPSLYKEQPLAQDWARIAKVIEELGEAIEAMIGYTAQNPRKGMTHTRRDMLNELGDVVMTGILAIQHFTGDVSATRQIVRAKQDAIYARMKSLEQL